MNKRRKMVIVLGASVIAAPLSSFAQQQGKIWRVGFLSPRHVDYVDSDVFYGPFLRGMRELGYVEGKNFIIEWRSAEGKYERLPALAIELVDLKPDIIVTASTVAAHAVKRATTTIPIVLGVAGDPVASGLAKSLAYPAGNVTGLTNMSTDLNLKQLEMLLSMVPSLSQVAVLFNPSNPANVKSSERIHADAQKLGVRILRAGAQTPQEIDNAFSLMRQQKAGALILLGQAEPFFQQQKQQIVELTAKYRLPSIECFRKLDY